MNLIDNLMLKLGYVNTSVVNKLEQTVENQSTRINILQSANNNNELEIKRLELEINRLETISLKSIVDEIRKARMTAVTFDSHAFSNVVEYSSDRVSKMAKLSSPVEPNWYNINYRIDVSVLQRVRENLVMMGMRDELDFLLENLLLRMKRDIEIAMNFD